MEFLKVVGGPQRTFCYQAVMSKETSFSFWRGYNQQSLILLKKDDAQGDVQEPSACKSSQSRVKSGACSEKPENLNNNWLQNKHKVFGCILKISDEEDSLV